MPKVLLLGTSPEISFMRSFLIKTFPGLGVKWTVSARAAAELIVGSTMLRRFDDMRGCKVELPGRHKDSDLALVIFANRSCGEATRALLMGNFRGHIRTIVFADDGALLQFYDRVIRRKDADFEKLLEEAVNELLGPPDEAA